MTKRTNVTLPLPGGMFTAGDPALIPDGASRRMRNVRLRPGPIIEARPATAYDGVMNVMGLFSWDDQGNQVPRLCSFDTSRAVRVKGVSGETWSGGISNVGPALTGTRVTDATNYGGIVYFMLDDGAGKPTDACSLSSTSYSSAPFDSVIASRTITAFNERLFLSYPRVTVAPAGAWNGAYDWTNAALWVQTNVTVANVVAGTTTVGRLFPTSTAAVVEISAAHLVGGVLVGYAAVPVSTVNTPWVWRQDFRPGDRTYRVPMTMELVLLNTVKRSTAYVIGDVVTASGVAGTYYRVTAAGTTAAGAVVLTATPPGTATVDGTVTFVAEGSDIIGAMEFNLPNLTDTAGKWVTRSLSVSAPWSTNAYLISPFLKLHNTASPLLTVLSPVDISLKDGIADGTPGKQNYGLQLTQGDFFYPFRNTETATTATIDLEQEIWSEIKKPRTIRAANFLALNEAPGLPTAACALTGRKLTFKRTAFWVFQGSADPDFPLIRERVVSVAGCVGPRALDVFENTVYFVGENGVYRWNAGMGDTPEELCGQGMYEEMTSKATATWVESQSTYKHVLLKVDRGHREVWVYLQKGLLYCYSLDRKAWTTHDIAGGVSSGLTIPRGKEIADMVYHPTTNEMYFAVGGFGLVRIDPANGGFDIYDNVGTNAAAYPEVWPKALELQAEGRVDATLEELGVKHNIEAVISLRLDWSSNGGNTFAANTTDLLAIAVGYTRAPITLFQTAPSMQLKLYGAGGVAGSYNFRISALDVWLQIHSGEWPQIIPTVSGSTL